MSGPTLFSKGKLIAHAQSESQDVLDKHRPIDYIMDWFGSRIQRTPVGVQDRMLVLLSSTGSGKSTTVPPEFFTRFFERTGRRNVCCTQPRVLTSQEIPKTIIQFHPELQMGVNIGFQNGVQAKRPTRGIIFMTVGVLQQQLKIMSDEDFLKKYSIIIIDEAHERSIGTDLTLAMMKQLINRNVTNQECPFLVVMSATFNPEKFADYMLDKVQKPDRYRNIIKVSGFSHPIEEVWLQYDTVDYVRSAVDTAVQIHESNLLDVMELDDLKSEMKQQTRSDLVLTEDAIQSRIKQQKFRDILIFVAGEGDAKRIVKELSKMNSDRPSFNKYPIIPIKLMGEDVTGRTENYVNITKPYNKMGVEVRSKNQNIKIVHPTRRIIVATNVAETGITIETLKYVIDTGYNKSNEYDPIIRAEMLITKPVTQSMYKQRRGRVGRKAPGIAYPLYTKETFDSLIEDQFPDIIKKDTALDLLSLIMLTADPAGEYNTKSIADLMKTPTIDEKSTTESIRLDIRKRIIQNMIKEHDRYNLNQYETTLVQSSIDTYKFDIIDQPSADSMHTSLDRLFTLGAIYRNATPTMVGLIINKFRFINLEAIKSILAGYAWEVSIIDLITLAAITSVKQDLKINPRDLDLQQYSPDPDPDVLIFSCDFTTTLVWWYRYQDVCTNYIYSGFDKKSKHESPDEWCVRNGLKQAFFNDVAAAREDIILSMAGIGLNPYAWYEKSYPTRSSLDTPEWISNIKQCLFEGYKSNMCIWNPINRVYETRYGRLSVVLDKPFLASGLDLVEYGGQNPKFIIYDSLTYRQDSKSNEYRPALKYVSVLDGFIPIDPGYDE